MKDSSARAFGARAISPPKGDRTTSAFEKERNRIRAANDEKTARLRGLRLAKEAQEREEEAIRAAAAALNPPPVKRRTRKAPAAVPTAETEASTSEMMGDLTTGPVDKAVP